MYIIKTIDSYSGHAEYFTGLDPVTRRAKWTRDSTAAVRFADQVSAEVFADPALIARGGVELVELEPDQASAMHERIERLEEETFQKAQRIRALTNALKSLPAQLRQIWPASGKGAEWDTGFGNGWDAACDAMERSSRRAIEEAGS